MTTKTKTEAPLRMIDPSIIFRNPNNPRPYLGDLGELTASIEAHGIIHPILVRPCDGGYMVVAGSRRLAVALRLELQSIPCHVKDMDDETAFEIATAENIVRKDMSVIDEIRAVESLAQSGESHAEIAARFGRPARWVATRAKIATMPESVLDLIASGELGLALAEELTKVADAEEQVGLAEWAVNNEADVTDVRNLVKSALRDLSKSPWAQKECASCILRSDKQCDLFGDADDPARCMDMHCWTKKRETWGTAKEAELRKAGHLPKEQFHSPYNIINAFGGYLMEGRDDTEIAELVEAGVKPRYHITEDNEVLLRYYYPDMPEKVVKTSSGDDEVEEDESVTEDTTIQDNDCEAIDEDDGEAEEEDASQPPKESAWMRRSRLKKSAMEQAMTKSWDEIDRNFLIEFSAEVLRVNIGDNPMDEAVEHDGVTSVVGMARERLSQLLLATIAGELFGEPGDGNYADWQRFTEAFGIVDAETAQDGETAV